MHSENGVYIQPASFQFYNTNWKYNLEKRYLHLNNYLYLNKVNLKHNNNNLIIILELSTENVFKTIEDNLLKKSDSNFHIYDHQAQEIIFNANKNSSISKQDIIEEINHQDSSVQLENVTYNVHVNQLNNTNLSFITLIPDNVILSRFSPIFDSLSEQIIFYSVAGLIFLFITAIHLSNKLNALTINTHKIMQFDFKNQSYKPSRITEIQQLSDSMKLMSSMINRILSQIVIIAKTDNLFQLGAIVEKQINHIANGKSNLYIINSEGIFISYEGTSSIKLKNNRKSYTCTQGKNGYIDYYFNLFNETNVIGCLKIIVKPTSPLSNEQILFIERLVNLVSISIAKHQLLDQQKALFLSFTKSIASAIDAKSPHTAGHCQRVPELTLMLARAAQKNEVEWKEFSLSKSQWEELYLASWLHDCGKLTTADHVIDKATKLDMFTNRIHEIRTRYEILKRDAELAYLHELLKNRQNTPELESHYHNTIKELDEEFAFIAQSNLGAEFFSEDSIERLNKIAKRTFIRTLDKQLGLSWEEKQRLSDADKIAPAIESILQDSTSHLIPWEQNRKANEQFNLKPQAFKFNHGEIYNLTVQRGTLTSEERFLINDHIIQTINMLKELPYPDHLKNIPLIAGGHHEQMSGNGYPHGIPASELPVTARMMAIADIFEALTACDRPYKTPKSLSESLKILAVMAKNKHIDIALFSLFLKDEVYITYANKFLQPGQIDEVNIQELIEIAHS
ncbi:HD-GYP domain-containing protein [Aliivibrio wodanis]|uniref:HD-GYP domain-containing protein n=1 Tax=Aliivibrio wodanis TaxID=80852 RepID=UPI00406CBB7E